MIRLNALGAPELKGDVDASAAGVPAQPRVLALLAYLALARPRGFHRRDALVALFWPELDHEGARNALRQVLHRLRKAIGEDAITARGAEEIGVDAARIVCDVIEFEAACEAGDVSAAMRLYRGELLPGFHLPEAPEFVRWLDAERARLRELAARAAWTAAESASRAGDHQGAAELARRATAMTPDDEGGVRRQIGILLAGGDRAAALRAYEAFERRLAKEFGVAPAKETRALVTNLPTEGIAAASPNPTPSPTSSQSAALAAPARSRLPMLVAVAAMVVIAAALWIDRGDATTAPMVKTMAVMPFSVRGSDDVRYLGEGMATLLAAKLNDGTGFRASDPHAVTAALRGDSARAIDLGSAAAVARSVEAGWMITGQLIEIAGRIEVSATLYELRARPRVAATASVEGETPALFQLVDELTGRLLAGIAVGRDTSLVRLSAMTTASFPALMAFLEGEQALRAGFDARAVTAYRRAVELDSTFALAMYRAALASTWASLPGAERAPEYAARAARLSDRLSPFARELVRGYDAYKALRADEAERIYRDLVTSHPDNLEGWMMLGETLFHYNPPRGRPSAEGRAPFERVLELDPDNPHALTHLARQAALDGRVAALDSLVARYAASHGDAERLLELRGLAAWARDDARARAEVAAAAIRMGDVGFVGVFQGGLNYAQNPAAHADLLPAARRGDRRYEGLQALVMESVDVELARGRSGTTAAGLSLDGVVARPWRLESEALLAADPAFVISADRARELRATIRQVARYPSINHLLTDAPGQGGEAMRQYLIGLLSVRLGDSADVAAAAAALRRMEATAPRARAFGLALRAEERRSRGDLPGALATLDSFPFDLATLVEFGHYGVRERFVRGELLAALGRDTEALDAYASLVNAYDLPFVALSHQRRAGISERRGDREAARFHYRRFLQWWGEADPPRQPLVAAAREALARIER